MTKKSIDDKNVKAGRLLLIFSETVQSHVWQFSEMGVNRPHTVANGDMLVVFNDKACREILWKGVVKFDYDSLQRPQGRDPQKSEQFLPEVGTVQGVPVDVDTTAWAGMFKSGKSAALIPSKFVTKSKR